MNHHINSVFHYTQHRSSSGANSGSQFRAFLEDKALLSAWQNEETYYSNLQMFRFTGIRKRYGQMLSKIEYTAHTHTHTQRDTHTHTHTQHTHTHRQRHTHTHAAHTYTHTHTHTQTETRTHTYFNRHLFWLSGVTGRTNCGVTVWVLRW